MTNNEKITKLLRDYPKFDTLFGLTKSDTPEFVEAFNLALDAGLFEKSGNSYRWNKTALDIIERRWTYDQYLRKVNKVKTPLEVISGYIMEHWVPAIVSAAIGAVMTYLLTAPCN